MKNIFIILCLFMGATLIAAPPPPIVRNTYTTNYCTDLLANCRGIIIANNNTSIVANPQWNTIVNPNIASTLSGGIGNSIQRDSTSSFIGSGQNNVIYPTTTFSSVVGGFNNIIVMLSSPNSYGFIGGGLQNSIQDGAYNVIGGGNLNVIEAAQASIIAGGSGNNINPGVGPVIGTGLTISGGAFNAIDIEGGIAAYTTIGGGTLNLAFSNYCTVAGGVENFIFGLAGTVGGGGHNTIDTNADHGTISGGSLNSITNGSYCTIAGGSTNSITNGFASTISGGYNNHMDSQYSTIAGGLSNKIWGASSTYGFIGGGHFNVNQNFDSVIGGGFGNFIAAGASGDSTISGGMYNKTIGDFCTIIGGRENTNASGDYSTILGGYSNRTEGAVSVVGGRAGCAIGDGTWFFKDNSSGRRSNNVANSFETYFTGGDNKLGVLNVTMTGTNKNFQGTRSDGVVTPLIGLVSDTNRIRSSGANFGVIFNNSADTFLTRMDNSGNWGFGTNVPQAKIHILGTATNVAVLRFANCDTNAPVTPATYVRYLAIILDDGLKYFIPLAQ